MHTRPTSMATMLTGNLAFEDLLPFLNHDRSRVWLTNLARNTSTLLSRIWMFVLHD